MARDCPICHGTGFETRTRDAGVLTASRCSCTRLDRGTALLVQARFPRRYEHCAFDTFEAHDPSHGPALVRARRWVELWPAEEAQKNGLLAIGPPGTGKTHLAVAMGRTLIETKGATVLFYEQRELLKALQSTYDGVSGIREAEILRTLVDAEVLILDDLGAGRTTPWARDVMHDIIVQRYNDMKPLILTSNLATGGTGDEAERTRSDKRTVDAPLTLRDRLGDALMSRLYEMCEILRLEGTDYRIGVRQHSRSC